MSKPSRKLSLRKETVRQLDASELAQVGGGVTLDWVILKQPSKTTGPTGTDPSLNYYNFNYNLYYWY
ncbi:MAG TPA: class I lanthipeptide [Kofleriaceae bacterium]|jgi:hypothetical protein